MPDGYGIKPESEGRLVPWNDLTEKLESARNYWIVTASLQGVPHSAPIWGIWIAGIFYFGTDPASRKGRNIATNPAVVLHLESGDEAVIVEGNAERVPETDFDPELDALYKQKYEYPLAGNPTYRVTPTKILAWSEMDFPESATRWLLPPPSETST